jgi:hypothetical protein
MRHVTPFHPAFLLIFAVGCTPGSDSDSDVGGDTDAATEPLVPGVLWLDDLRPVDVTSDGRTALMQDMTSIAGPLVFVDVATGAITPATELGDATADLAGGLSDDLHIAALHGVPVEAGVWSAADDWQDLASPYAAGCDINDGGAWDLSADGTVVVGMMWDGCAPLAFRWTAGTGVVPLATLGTAQGEGAHATNRATTVSNDGRVAAGFASHGALDRTPARWTADGQGELLDPDNQDAPGEVLAIDGDGTTLAGLRGLDGFVWTEAGGFVDLGRTENALPSDQVFPNALTADGRAAFGAVGSEFFTVPTAFVWTANGGMQALQPLVEAGGIELGDGFLLTNVLAASDDGSVLLGTGLDADFAPKTFMLRLPGAAYGL